jgi:hypothetical protein
MNLELDFVRVPARVGASGLALLGCGVLAAVFSVQQYIALNGEIAARERVEAPRETIDPRVPAVDLDQLRARLLAANKIVEKRTTPWDALFRDIEAVADKKVGLLSVQPELAGRQVRITGEAHDAAALAAYITRLSQKASLRDVYLTDHEMRQVDGQPVIRFGLAASWVLEPA